MTAKVPFHIVDCEKQSGRNKPWSTTVDDLLKFKTEQQLIEFLHEDLVEDESDVEITLHSGADCNIRIDLAKMRTDFRGPPPYKRAQVYEHLPFICMHINPRENVADGEGDPRPQSSLVPGDVESPTPVSGQQHSVPTTHKPTTRKKLKMSKMSKKSKNPQMFNDTRYIRVGTIKSTDRKVAGLIRTRPVVLAAMDGDDQKIVEFTTVDTWRFNDTQVGRIEQGLRIDNFDLMNDIKMDMDFRLAKCTTKKALDSCLGVVAHTPEGTEAYVTINGSTHAIKARPLPVEPEYNDTPWLQPTLRTSEADVESVVTFVNNFNSAKKGKDVSLPTNNHLTLEWNESRASFTDSALDNVELPGSTLTVREYLEDVFGRRWTTEVWVMAQQRGSTDLYRWDATSDLSARDWVDEELESEFGRQLYIEVCIEGGIAKNEPTSDRGPNEA